MTDVLTDEGRAGVAEQPDPGAPPHVPARARPGRRTVAILGALIVLGGLWRLASFGFNVWPHGDVVLDAAIAESVAWRGQLLVPFVDVRYYPTNRFGFGYPLDQHPPLWPLLGVPLVWLVGDGYTALKLVSLAVGISAIPLAYVALRRHVGAGPALFASGLVAASYPLVDFSGNGSLWVLLAAFYLVWLWALPDDPPPDLGQDLTPHPPLRRGEGEPGVHLPRSIAAGRGSGGGASRREARRWLLVGLVMGLAYLTNYPAIVLPAALGVLQLLRHGRRALRPAALGVLQLLRHGRRALRPAALAGPALAGMTMLVVVSPWLIHNVALFGSPIWSQPFQRTLAGGSRQVEYLVVDGEAVKRNLPASGDRLAGLRARAMDLYGNVGFVARQSLVLTPVLGGLVLVGLLLLAPLQRIPGLGAGALAPRPPLSRHQARGAPRAPHWWPGDERAPQPGHDPLPVAVLAVVHLALILWWPTTKFRYLVPLLPLVFAVGAWCLWQFGPAGLRGRLAIVTAALCLFTNAWTMLSIPSRTYYYDGGLVGDNFGQQGERLFVEDARRFRAAADAIVARGHGVVLGDHILAPFTRMPLVVNSSGYPADVVEHLVRRYAIRYVVADRAHADDYAFLHPVPLWSDDRLIVLELPPR